MECRYNKKRNYHLFRILVGRNGKGLNLNGTLYFTALWLVGLMGCCANALTQSHQGSAPTNAFMLNSGTPNARIQINSSDGVFVVNVELPPPSIDSLEEEPQHFKVSLHLLAMQLCEPSVAFNGDRLKVIYSDPTTIKSTTWKFNVSYDDTSENSSEGDNSDDKEAIELTNIQANQIVLIPEGRWIKSGADLVATLYQDPSSDGTCPEDSFPCACKSSSEESSTTVEPSYSTSQEIHAGEVTRCIPKSLVCNGHPNCGLGCQVDESEVYCESPTSQSSNPTPTITSCTRPDPTTTVKPPTKDDGGSGGVTWNNPKETFGTILGLNALVMMVVSRLLV